MPGECLGGLYLCRAPNKIVQTATGQSCQFVDGCDRTCYTRCIQQGRKGGFSGGACVLGVPQSCHCF
jgi:hypothetical protein